MDRHHRGTLHPLPSLDMNKENEIGTDEEKNINLSNVLYEFNKTTHCIVMDTRWTSTL